MKQRWIAGSSLLAVMLMMTACDEVINTRTLTGSGEVIEQTYNVSDFNRVEASQTFKVTITQGDAFEVRVRADDNVMEEVSVKRRGDSLQIGLKGDSYHLKNVTLEANVVMPALAGLQLSGSSDGNVTGFESESAFDTEISGSSVLQIELAAGDVQIALSGNSRISGQINAAGKLTLQTSGSSDAAFDGSAGKGVDLDLSGASTLAGDLDLAGDVKVQLSGDSRVEVPVSGEIGALALEVGGSSLFKMENVSTADVTIEVSGSSTVEMTGSGTGLTVDAGGSSTVALVDFTVTDAQVKASGGSVIALNVSGTLDVDAGGSSRINYQGEPTLGTMEVSAGSSVEPLE